VLGPAGGIDEVDPARGGAEHHEAGGERRVGGGPHARHRAQGRAQPQELRVAGRGHFERPLGTFGLGLVRAAAGRGVGTPATLR
jgi:hypothetical protein